MVELSRVKHIWSFTVLLTLTIVLTSCSGQSNTSNTNESSYHVDIELDAPDSPFVKTFELPSLDSLPITADLRHISHDNDIIILCHQAGWSRGEYVATSDSLYRLGFNCLAIDQRSGEGVNDIANETAKKALAAGIERSFESAEQDISATLQWVRSLYNGNIVLIGSSYSAGLVLKIGAEDPDGISKIIAFSPGEYYREFKLADCIKKLKVPCLLTSSKKEANGVQKLFKVIKSSKKIQFIPSREGDHGSRVLWQSNANNEEYWSALKTFLDR